MGVLVPLAWSLLLLDLRLRRQEQRRLERRDKRVRRQLETMARESQSLVTRPVRPALVIADGWLATGTDGVDVVRRVREEYNDEDLPGLIVSADVAALVAARAAGMVALRKPFTPASLGCAAREALAARAE